MARTQMGGPLASRIEESGPSLDAARRLTLGLASAAAALWLVAALLPARAVDLMLGFTKICVKYIVVGADMWGDDCRGLPMVPTFKKASV
ncbi:hypothetical protein GCM10023166_31880 [Paeniglutamicibacter cryotolerans]